MYMSPTCFILHRAMSLSDQARHGGVLVGSNIGMWEGGGIGGWGKGPDLVPARLCDHISYCCGVLVWRCFD